MSTTKQIEANRANAQLSTGPTSVEGKAKSSLNGVKTALTGRTVLLPDDDLAAYQAHVARTEAKYQAATDDERLLVQSIVDSQWRLLRIPALEAALYAMGRREFAPLFAEEAADVRAALADAKTYQAYRRDFSNLSIQENRLTRKLEKEIAALEALQKPRKELHQAQLSDTAYCYVNDKDKAAKRYSLQAFRANGFAFSTEEWIDAVTDRELSQGNYMLRDLARVDVRKRVEAEVEAELATEFIAAEQPI